MKKIVLISLVFILSVFTAIEVNAQDESATASIEFTSITPLETTLDTDLVITELVVTDAAQTFQVLETGAIVGADENIDIASLATFNLSGGVDEEVAITVDNGDVLLGPADEYVFSNFSAADVTLDGSGAGSFSLAFDLAVGASAPTGTFTAEDAIEVTATYAD